MRRFEQQEERVSVTTSTWSGGASGYSEPKSRKHFRKEKIIRLFQIKKPI